MRSSQRPVTAGHGLWARQLLNVARPLPLSQSVLLLVLMCSVLSGYFSFLKPTLWRRPFILPFIRCMKPFRVTDVCELGKNPLAINRLQQICSSLFHFPRNTGCEGTE